MMDKKSKKEWVKPIVEDLDDLKNTEGKRLPTLPEGAVPTSLGGTTPAGS